MKFKPLEDRITIRRREAEKMYKGLIHLPEQHTGKPQLGEVISVGEGKQEGGSVYAMTVKPGDLVLFGKYAGTDIKLNGEDLIVMRESDILGICEAEEGDDETSSRQ